jgi:hypothetical protein
MRNYLGEHPEIFMASDVEPQFFGTDLDSPRFIRDEKQYFSLFAEAKDEKRVGEKSPRYLLSVRAATEIKAYEPSSRIIIMLRNPVDMLNALHTINLNHGFEDIFNLKAALVAEMHRKAGQRLPPSIHPAENWLLLYRETVRYAEQVQRYLDAFGREQIHIIIFDDIVSDVARVYRETLRFLYVDPDFQTDFRRVYPTIRYRSRALNNFLNKPPPRLRSLVLALTPLQVRDRITKGIRFLNKAPVRAPDLKLRRQLQAELVPEVEQLSKLLDRDLTHWCQSD